MTPTRTRRCWASSRCSTALPATRSGTCALSDIDETAQNGPDSAAAPCRCRSTRRAGRSCSAAWPTASPSGTANPHVIVTKGTKAGRSPASTAYVSHLLDGCGVPPRAVRCTRLADLVNTIDPKLVAAAFGMKPEGVMFYLADHVDDGRDMPDGMPS